MLLTAKTAIVYGGAGSIGSAVSRVFAGEGARVFLTGRTVERLDQTASSIHKAGGMADVAKLNALDQAAVEAHAARVVEAAGAIDIAFNAVSNDDVQGTPLVDMSYEDVARPVTKAVAVHFNIATAVARHMMARRSGAILAMAGGREAIPSLGGSHVAWSALAGLCRQLAADLGPYGVRVAWLLSPGSPEPGAERQDDPLAEPMLLKRPPTYDDVANTAVFLASDCARTMTATEVNITGGSVVD